MDVVAGDCSFLQISLEAGQDHRALHCEREQSLTGLTYSAARVAHLALCSRRHEVSSGKRCDVGLAQEIWIEDRA